MAEQKIPELWWSPKDSFIYADRTGGAPHYLQLKDSGLFGLPEDAVRLVPAPSEQTYEWGYRWDNWDPDEGCPASESFCRGVVRLHPASTKLLKRRAAGPWETVEEASE